MNVSVVVGGRWHAFDFARELHRRGALHRLITNYPRFAVTRYGVPSDRIVALPANGITGRVLARLGEAAAMRAQHFLHRWFARSAAGHLEGSDVIHCLSSFAEPSLAWARRTGVPCFLERLSSHIVEQSALMREEFSIHGMTWCPTHPEIERMEVREYGACDRIVVPSMFVHRTFLKRGVDASKLTLNPLGVDLRNFNPAARAPEPPNPANMHVMYAGALSVRKGIVYLMRGFAQAKRPGWRLSLIGSSAHEARRWIDPCPEAVDLVGLLPQSQLAERYRRAHCFVMPSIEEGMAMVQMQAMACGLPLICTTNTGGEDLLRLSGEGTPRDLDVIRFPAGFLVPIRRPDAIAWCLKELSLDPQAWLGMRDAALSVARTSLDWSRYCDRAIASYEQVRKHRSSGCRALPIHP